MRKMEGDLSWKNCFRAAFSVFVLFVCISSWKHVVRFLGVMFQAAAPIILGIVMGYILNILMNFYERHYFPRKVQGKRFQKSRRPVCLAASFVTLIVILVWLTGTVIPELVSCVKFLTAEIPPAIEELFASEWMNEVLPEDVLYQLSSMDLMEHVLKIVQKITSGLGDAANVIINAVSSTISIIVNVFIGTVFSVYLLFGKEKIKVQSMRVMGHYLPEKWNEKILYGLSVLNDSFHKYIVGQCTEAVILGVLCFAGMVVFRFPYAGMIGTLIGFTALIPIAGAYIGAGVGAIMILTVSPLKSVLFLVFLVVLQQLEGNLIYPRVVGKSIGLPALWVLAAVTIGGKLSGILGMMIGVPIAAAVYRLVCEDMERRESCPDEGDGLC